MHTLKPTVTFLTGHHRLILVTHEQGRGVTFTRLHITLTYNDFFQVKGQWVLIFGIMVLQGTSVSIAHRRTNDLLIMIATVNSNDI